MPISFRLFNLPENALLNVIRSMEVVHLTCLSFCSLKTKKLIKLLKLTAVICPGFNGNDIIWITLNSPKFYIEYGLDEDNIIASYDLCTYRPYSILIETYRTNDKHLAKWVPYKPILYKKLVDHFLEIFHQREISLFISSSYFTEDTIIKTLGMYNMRHLDCIDSPMFEGLMRRLPQPKQLDLFGSRELDEQYWKPEVYIQNYDSFSASGLVTLSFDDMLSMNAKILNVDFEDINEKHLNLFVRLWIKGSLSRLEYIHLIWQNRGTRVFDKVKVLKGINYSENPENEERIFTRSSEKRDFDCTEICKGGFDIRARNGRKATIVLNSEHPYFEMFVWP